VKPAYAALNDKERNRLEALLDQLTDDNLARRLPNGLTVAIVLAHLAFWDDYTCQVLREWQQSGFSESRTHFEAVNSAIATLAAAVPARVTVELARAAARAVDREAEAISPELAEKIEANGKLRTLERAQHRRTHVDQIAAALASE
jgi:hypothetical protein